MAFGINLGCLLAFLVQAEHVNSLWTRQGSKTQTGNTNVGFVQQRSSETWRPHSYPPHQFRQAVVASGSPSGAGVHRPAAVVGGTSRREPPQGREGPRMSQSAQGNYHVINIRPRTLEWPTVQKPGSYPPGGTPLQGAKFVLGAARDLRPTTLERPAAQKPRSYPPGAPPQGPMFGLSTAIASGSAIHNGKGSTDGKAHGDGIRASFSRRLTGTERAGAPAALRFANYGQRSASFLRTPGSGLSGAAPAAGFPPQKQQQGRLLTPGRRVTPRRPSAHKQYYPRSYLLGAGPGRPQETGGLPATVVGYGKFEPGHAGTLDVSPVYGGRDRHSTNRQDGVPPPRSFRTGTSGKGFAPTKIQNIPLRFGGTLIQRLRDPIQRGAATGVSQPLAAYSAPMQKRQF
ncbi:hypothetical protein NHX12_023729 [Muraenolepis orangiensis]|uniref:Uncharacterized protein n=1 Tax=Muraenolepis orangiensis TaxID=630683 RepID=A0A9Q0IT05_9TELE|nr:hypothetical protein NHX12_023729 [Muraenolepis orangiensis]